MSNLEQLQSEGRREFEERFSKEWWKGFGTTDDIDRQGIDGLLSFQDSLIARAFEAGRKSNIEKIEPIVANFNRNGLVDETANKINEIINVVNALSSS